MLVAAAAITAFLSAARVALLSVLVIRDARRRRTSAGGNAAAGRDPLPICVSVPVYNESEVIGRTLESLLASDHPDFSVLVIDDGSTDGTADVVGAAAENDARIRLLRQPNAGKAAALNRGFAAATTDVVVTLDGDTLVQRQTLSALAAPFASDPAVHTVCGHVVVSNANRCLLARMQEVEYVTGQNYYRRACASLNCISVVPGATGAWRRRAVLDAGGCSMQTLTEDADLTLTVMALGGRIAYAPGARGVTEVPETGVGFSKQRFRWTYGTLQCLWKHRRLLGRGTIGCIALPDVVVFQIILPIFTPVSDAVLLLCLWRRDFGAVAAGYAALALMDVLGSTIAFRLDGRRLGHLWALLPQRVAYRPFLCVITLRALVATLAGRRHGWNKLARTGAVSTPGEPHR